MSSSPAWHAERSLCTAVDIGLTPEYEIAITIVATIRWEKGGLVKLVSAVLAIAAVVLLCSCGTTGAHDLASSLEGGGVVWYRADRRGQVIVPEVVRNNDGTIVMSGDKPLMRYKALSENPPDVSIQASIDAALKAEYAGVSGEARLKFGETALKLGARTERVELLRDSLFALNQAVFNMPHMPSADFIAAYKTVLIAVLGATLSDTQAEAAQLIADADSEAERITSELSMAKAELASLTGLDMSVMANDDAVSKAVSAIAEPNAKAKAKGLQKQVKELEAALERVKATKKTLDDAFNKITSGISKFLETVAPSAGG